MSIKQTLFNHIKNLPGWRTNRKLVVISVDDYGNVRLDSKRAREKMDKAGLKIHSRFDAYDTLETREDLEALYEVLTSVKDKNGRHAVFTPFALPCNINFEAMDAGGYERYVYELLPQTYEKLSAIHPEAYTGAWNIWQQGIQEGLMAPQFHGREHLNVNELNEKLALKDKELLETLVNRSYTSVSKSLRATRGWTAAFAYWDPVEIQNLCEIAADGLNKFEKVYKVRPIHFMAPTANVPSKVVDKLVASSIQACDYAQFNRNHEGHGSYSREFSYTGQKKNGHIKLVRNVVFEPTQNDNAVEIALMQVSAAFNMRKPAIISSHRVNFCGHIDVSNRDIGLSSLKDLLKTIVDQHPEVEFISSAEMIDEMKKYG